MVLTPFITHFLQEDPVAQKYSMTARHTDVGEILAECCVRHEGGRASFSGSGTTLEAAMNALLWKLLHSEYALLCTLGKQEPVGLIDDDSTALMDLAKRLSEIA